MITVGCPVPELYTYLSAYPYMSFQSSKFGLRPQKCPKFGLNLTKKNPKNQNIKNPLDCSLDDIHMKLCTNFYDHLVTQCLQKMVPVEKNDISFNYRNSHTFGVPILKYRSWVWPDGSSFGWSSPSSNKCDRVWAAPLSFLGGEATQEPLADLVQCVLLLRPMPSPLNHQLLLSSLYLVCPNQVPVSSVASCHRTVKPVKYPFEGSWMTGPHSYEDLPPAQTDVKSIGSPYLLSWGWSQSITPYRLSVLVLCFLPALVGRAGGGVLVD